MSGTPGSPAQSSQKAVVPQGAPQGPPCSPEGFLVTVTEPETYTVRATAAGCHRTQTSCWNAWKDHGDAAWEQLRTHCLALTRSNTRRGAASKELFKGTWDKGRLRKGRHVDEVCVERLGS